MRLHSVGVTHMAFSPEQRVELSKYLINYAFR